MIDANRRETSKNCTLSSKAQPVPVMTLRETIIMLVPLVYVPGFMHESLMQHLQTQWRVDTTRREYEARKALSDGRPRVVLMIPSRPNLHPGTHGKQSESCMHVWQALRFCMWRV